MYLSQHALSRFLERVDSSQSDPIKILKKATNQMIYNRVAYSCNKKVKRIKVLVNNQVFVYVVDRKSGMIITVYKSAI